MANLFNKVPKETVRAGVYVALAGLAGMQVFPVLRDWEVFASFPSKHYMEKEVCECKELKYLFFRSLSSVMREWMALCMTFFKTVRLQELK